MRWWTTLDKRLRLAILCGWPLIACGVFGYLSWGDLAKLGPDPMLDRVSFLQREVDDESLWAQIREFEEMEAEEWEYAARKDEVEAEMARIASRSQQLLALLPSQVRKGPMRQRLQNFARAVPENVGEVDFIGMTVQEPDLGGRRAASSEQEVIYRVQAEGDLGGIIHYLWQIENSTDRFMAIRRIDITPGRVRVDTQNEVIERTYHRLNLDVLTYVVPQDDVARQAARTSGGTP